MTTKEIENLVKVYNELKIFKKTGILVKVSDFFGKNNWLIEKKLEALKELIKTYG